MAFTDADIRASHTIRIFGTNRDKEVLQDIWLDIERIDIYRITTKSPRGQFQGVIRRLYWLDDPDDPSYREEGNQARTEGTLKICSPDEADQEDPDEWIPVRTIIEMSWNESTSNNQWKVRRGNRTDAENLARRVAARRCFHRDTIIDDDVDAATAEDPDRKAYVVASDKYNFVEGTDDKDTFIEVQYVSYTFDQSSAKEDEGKHQGVQFSLKNSHYLRITDPAEGPVNPVHGFDPPWALDPFQAIVNVNFGLIDTQWVLTTYPEINHGSSDFMKDASIRSMDDTIDGPGKSAASGKAITVKGDDYIAYGKVTIREEEGKKVRENVFLAASRDGVVRLGAIVTGDLSWSTLWTLPGDQPVIYGCSYAKDAFFISYKISNDETASSLAVIRDVRTFDKGINPFPGVADRRISGNVVYRKPATNTDVPIYLTTSEAPFDPVNDPYHHMCLATSTSNDGLHWTPRLHAAGFYTGIGAQTDGQLYIATHQSTVAFGNGVFVAAAAKKHRIKKVSTTVPPLPDYVLLSCAVALSADGVTWRVIELPGAFYQGSFDTGDYEGAGTAVVFCKDKEVAAASGKKGITGYFVAAGYEAGVLDGVNTTTKSRFWRSVDGSSWTVIETTSSEVFTGLSAVAKDLSKTRIVKS